MLIITQVKTTLRMKFRKENLLFGDQNYRFPQPGVTVGQQSFKEGELAPNSLEPRVETKCRLSPYLVILENELNNILMRSLKI